jgi:hypothetical protein
VGKFPSVNTFHFPESLYQSLMEHLFRPDGDEHGAVVAAGIAEDARGRRYLARRLFIAADGKDYVAGKHGYRMLRAEFVYECIRVCREHGLAYFAVHNHGGSDYVDFSSDDMASHERGYPALLDVMRGLPVGALVFAKRAVAADIWLPTGQRQHLAYAQIYGATVQKISPKPLSHGGDEEEQYHRQILLFGRRGQSALKNARVGVIGLGGVGSMLVEYLARLGVGAILAADPDRIEQSNLSRVIGATRTDALPPGVFKTVVAERVAREANPDIRFEGIPDNFAKESVARRFLDCDFLFLAADTAQARLVFNALVQQYFIPGIQIGSKIVAGGRHELGDCYSVTRFVLPARGCLWCNGFISRERLAWEAKTGEEQDRQRYGTETAAPSVITMNGVGAAHAVNDFLFFFLGLARKDAGTGYRRYKHLTRETLHEEPRRDSDCPECGDVITSRFGKGDESPLPTLRG